MPFGQAHLASLMGQFQKGSKKRGNSLVLEAGQSQQCKSPISPACYVSVGSGVRLPTFDF